ncbi:MAG TPA: hypothetical protein VME68_06015 [Acidobacteriaceae bacterium]|nr:hypothetical protein [Acidobacteriaceae bacterium]
MKAYADKKGAVHIIGVDGREQTIDPKKWQAGAGYESVIVAPDGKTVGWLADRLLSPLEGSTNYSYPVALELDVWRDGRVIRKFSPSAYVIQNWIFLKDGEEVAFHTAPPHGQEFFNCTLFDVGTGKQLAQWELDRKDYVVPDWAKGLLVDADLPTPDEFEKLYPPSSAPNKATAKSQQNRP